MNKASLWLEQPLAVLQFVAMFLFASCAKDPGVSSVDIVQDELFLTVGESASLDVSVSPESALGMLEWYTCDSSIVVVDDCGLVVSTGKGETEVYVKAGDYSDCCRVVVSGVSVTDVVLSEENLELFVGETASINLVYWPDDAENVEVKWSSLDPEIASVDGNGLVTGLDEGSTEIVASVGNISATCFVAVSKALPKIGDYYYSDGTWSTVLDSDKEVIGVVFWIGNPSEHDPVLAEDHPECVNGLVVATGGDLQIAWQEKYWDYIVAEDYSQDAYVGKWIDKNTSGFLSIYTSTGMDDNLNKIVGYNNTKAIEMFNSNEMNSSWPVTAVEHIVAYRTLVNAPDISSDWYLPSPKELSLLCTGEWNSNIYDITGTETEMCNKINGILETIPMSEKLSTEENPYMSSSEEEWCYSVYAVYFYNGGLTIVDKGESSYRVRPVLAF